MKALVWRSLPIFALLASPTIGACNAEHEVPEHPTWVDVEPILRGECLHCHGGDAPTAGSAAGRVYRFDFFDLTPEVCGDATAGVDALPSALALASQIASAITSPDGLVRPRMPPAPASSLAGWEWQTILRFTDDPERGAFPLRNRPPTVRLTHDSRLADKQLTVSVVAEDPDGESVVGVLRVGDATVLKMDRPGAFVADLDASTWPEGELPIQAIVCDGWNVARYGLGNVTVRHR